MRGIDLPTRYLKPGIKDSERIESISTPDAEILYYRLLVSVDDFGRTDARPLMVKSLCFPVRVRATVDKCMQWMQELEKSELIVIYEVEGKRYLQITKWDNKPRAEKSKFPPVPDQCIQVHADRPQMLPVTVTKTVTETTTLSDKSDPRALNGYKSQAVEILTFLNEKTGRKYRPVEANLRMIEARLKEGASITDCRQVIAKKSREWLGNPKMDLCVRPKTLFNATNFAQYQGELVIPK